MEVGANLLKLKVGDTLIQSENQLLAMGKEFVDVSVDVHIEQRILRALHKTLGSARGRLTSVPSEACSAYDLNYMTVVTWPELDAVE
jgi:hypothetical protein